MTDQFDPLDSASESTPERKSEGRAGGRGSKRANKAAARQAREAELEKLNQQTLGRQLGIRVFEDGTVEKERSSSSAWLQSRLPGSGTNSGARTL